MPLDNRELASLLLLAVLVILALRSGKVRRSLGGIGRMVARPQISVPLLLTLAYVWASTRAGAIVGLWQPSLLKETIVWLLTVALVMLLNVNRVISDRQYVRTVVLETVSAVAVLEFVVGMATVSLWAEVALQVVLGFLLILDQVARHRGSNEVARLTGALLAISGLALLGNSVVQTVREWSNLDFGAIALEAALPVWLTLGFSPFILAFALYAAYERPMRQITRSDEGTLADRSRARLALVLGFRTKGHRLVGFGPYEVKQMIQAEGLSDALKVPREHIRRAEDRERSIEEEERRLERYAGVSGTDNRGRQLDRREFESTTKALGFLAACHMGHYRRLGRYREDMLSIASLSFDGLPEEHGVTMEVSDDGQTWWAWRRCITSWCFAVGAAEPPPELWRYDGPEPPAGPPRVDPSWGVDPTDGPDLNW